MDDAATQCGELVSRQVDERIDYERYGFGPDGGSIRPARSETMRLAVLEMPHGTRIEFWGDPVEDEVGMIELGGNSDVRPTFRLEPDQSFLQMYTRLVSKDVPVPEIFLKLEDPAEYETLRKKYPFQEYIEEPIEVADDQFDRVVSTPRASGPSSDSGVWNCNLGTQAFDNFACNGSYPSNAWIWCDASQHFNFLDRMSLT
jgi:hypothetical protein